MRTAALVACAVAYWIVPTVVRWAVLNVELPKGWLP